MLYLRLLILSLYPRALGKHLIINAFESDLDWIGLLWFWLALCCGFYWSYGQSWYCSVRSGRVCRLNCASFLICRLIRVEGSRGQPSCWGAAFGRCWVLLCLFKYCVTERTYLLALCISPCLDCRIQESPGAFEEYCCKFLAI